MLGLDTIELLALAHILLLDRDPAMMADRTVDAVEIYTIFLIVSTVMQLFGMLLVHWSYYRAGGALQIVASAPQVIKLEGIIGVVGGLEAWKYSRKQAISAGPAPV